MSPSALTRRRFFVLGGLGVLGALATGLGVAFRARRGAPATAERLLRALRVEPTKSALGNLGLRALPGEPDERAVLGALLAHLGSSARLTDDEALRRAVVDSVTSDYETGRTVWLGGFMMSRTEVRIAALQRARWASPTAATSPAG